METIVTALTISVIIIPLAFLLAALGLLVVEGRRRAKQTRDLSNRVDDLFKE